MKRPIRAMLTALVVGYPASLVAGEFQGPDPFGGADPFGIARDQVVEPANDHLHEVAEREFQDAYAPDVKLRVIVFPAFRANHAVGIKEANGSFMIFGLQHASHASFWELVLGAWNHRLPDLSKKIEDRVWRCEARIDPVLANRLLRASETMLRQSVLDNRMGLDGVAYLVAMIGPRGALKGHTWSPDRGSKSALFTDVAYTMGRFCVWFGYLYGSQLDRRVQDLEAELGR